MANWEKQSNSIKKIIEKALATSDKERLRKVGNQLRVTLEYLEANDLDVDKYVSAAHVLDYITDAESALVCDSWENIVAAIFGSCTDAAEVVFESNESSVAMLKSKFATVDEFIIDHVKNYCLYNINEELGA